MRPFLRKAGLVLALGSLVFFLSCERHHVGELPDEHAAEHETKPSAEEPHHEAKSDQPTATTQHSHTAQTPAPRNTPANFFPDKPKP